MSSFSNIENNNIEAEGCRSLFKNKLLELSDFNIGTKFLSQFIEKFSVVLLFRQQPD